MNSKLASVLSWLRAATSIGLLLSATVALADGNFNTNDVPQTIPYVGTIQQAGVALEGTLSLRLTLHDASRTPTSVWTEDHPGVKVAAGRFYVVLGSTTAAKGSALATELRKADKLELEVTFLGAGAGGANVVMAGRQPLLAAPYAHFASYAFSVRDASIGLSSLAANSVNSTKVIDDSLTAINLATSSVGLDELANGAVDNAAIVDGAVTTTKIADAQITTAKIANAQITTDKIADGAVTDAKIPNGTIATAKLANVTRTGGTVVAVAYHAHFVAWNWGGYHESCDVVCSRWGASCSYAGLTVQDATGTNCSVAPLSASRSVCLCSMPPLP